ncbi:hypothetical protein TSOC_000304 [Tetrabaena socialis]|uniref:Uncharacterized protein n=1 Tax=Tetrabaena socialis TaxID=47790 RepID=A0A2J8AJS4_9CHLO|nr:hypothetical protein TSOC_000304 [Tetrabaena socialis]|eukprot:PNH12776.1 hypothetical protein TSOC_000304 [Tetrabaena socialis]
MSLLLSDRTLRRVGWFDSGISKFGDAEAQQRVSNEFYLGGLNDGDAVMSTTWAGGRGTARRRDPTWRRAFYKLTACNAKLLEMVEEALGLFGASSTNGNVRLNAPADRGSTAGLHNQGTASHTLYCAERAKVVAYCQFMIRRSVRRYRAAVLLLSWATKTSGSCLRTDHLLQLIKWEQMHGRESTQDQADWEVLGAPSPGEYLPLHRLRGVDGEDDMTLAQQAQLLAAGGWTDQQFRAYVAGLFDADGSVFLAYAKNAFRLYSNIAQWSCPDLLAAIRDRLGYGTISCGKLLFYGPNAVRFWEEVVLPYGVSHVHRYGTYHLLACRGGHTIRSDVGTSPCAWHEDGGRLSSKAEGAPEQWVGDDKVWTNWATAMEDWTGTERPDWAM